MESGLIRDDQISASSSKTPKLPQNARLVTDSSSNEKSSWSPSDDDISPYLEVSFDEPTQITAISTQGGSDGGYVSKFFVEYLSTETDKWEVVSKEPKDLVSDTEPTSALIFQANFDSTSVVKNRLDVPIIVSKIRIYPVVDEDSTDVSLRIDLNGCGKGLETTTPGSSTEPTTTVYEVVNTTQVVVKTTKPLLSTPGQ